MNNYYCRANIFNTDLILTFVCSAWYVKNKYIQNKYFRTDNHHILQIFAGVRTRN